MSSLRRIWIKIFWKKYGGSIGRATSNEVASEEPAQTRQFALLLPGNF